MKDKKDKIIIGLSIALGLITIISAGTIIYIISLNNMHGFSANQNFIRGNFTSNNETLIQTEQVFSNAANQQDVDSYCTQSGNMIYCREYCQRINPSDNLCSGILMPSDMGVPQQ